MGDLQEYEGGQGHESHSSNDSALQPSEVALLSLEAGHKGEAVIVGAQCTLV